jgi:hydroxymethylbilane synthase
VLPLREFPTAAAQGALAIEVAARRRDLRDRLAAINHVPTWRAVARERAILASFGGGCHDPIGATVRPFAFGDVVSVRADVDGAPQARWILENAVASAPPRTDAAHIWPRTDERERATRVPCPTGAADSNSASNTGWFVARAEALPADWTIASDRIVWAAGTRTWQRLAARGIWVHGCADGLGDAEPPAADAIAGRPISWTRLTHVGAAADDAAAVGTYAVDAALPDDLPSRTHFFWTSGQLFRTAVERFPAIRGGWHASGPGRTAQLLRETLGDTARTSIWLEYEQWHQAVTS